MEHFVKVKEELKDKGADAIILGCTELSIIKRSENIGPGFIDALEVLAMCSITNCDKKIRKEYWNLITN